MEVSLPLALLGGILSFLSPCFLPIVPAFVGQLVGTPMPVNVSSQENRKNAAANAIGFILGFSLVFTALWVTVAFLGNLVGQYASVFRVIAGIVLMLMGLHVAGLVNIAPLNWTWRLPVSKPGQPVATRGNGWLRSTLLGIVFAAGWTPCIGPILSGILALATVSTTSGQGVVLMLAYCLGLGLPIFLVAVGAVEVQGRLGWFKRHYVAISLVSGGLLIVIGFMMVANLWGKLAGILPAIG